MTEERLKLLESLLEATDDLMDWDNNVLTDDKCCEEYKQSVRNVLNIVFQLKGAS